jgi:hypothetical protein
MPIVVIGKTLEMIKEAAFRVPRSAFRVPRSAFRVPRSAFRVPRSVELGADPDRSSEH